MYLCIYICVYAYLAVSLYTAWRAPKRLAANSVIHCASPAVGVSDKQWPLTPHTPPLLKLMDATGSTRVRFMPS